MEFLRTANGSGDMLLQDDRYQERIPNHTLAHVAINDLRQALDDLSKLHRELIAHTAAYADEHVIKQHLETVAKLEDEFGL